MSSANPLRFPSGASSASVSSARPTSTYNSSPNFPRSPSYTSHPAQTQQESMAQPQKAGQPRQIHRNRASYSCHSCRRRKVKCDRQHPTCGNCGKMGETCVYNDNSGKGANKEDKKNREREKEGSLEPPRSDPSRTSPSASSKRRRTNSGSYTCTDDESESSYTSHSRSNSMNQHGQSPFIRPQYDALSSANASPPPGPLSNGANKEGELEARMNRLAEIVDQWYKDAYSNGATGAPNLQKFLGSDDGTASLLATTPSSLKDSPRLGPSPQWLTMQQQNMADPRRFSSDDMTNPSLSSSPSVAQTPSPNPYVSTPRSLGSLKEHARRNLVLSSSIGASPNAGQLTSKLLNAQIDSTKPKEGETDNLALGHLSIQDGGRSRYVGSSFWALLSNEITELNQVLKTQTKTRPNKIAERIIASAPKSVGFSTPPSSTHPSPPGSEPISWQQPATTIDKAALLHFEPIEKPSTDQDLIVMIHALPPKHQCDALYQSFVHGVHPVMPLIHGPTFASEYKSFWSWYPDNIHSEPSSDLIDNPTFLPLLFSVLYAGAMSMSSKVIKTVFEGRTKESVTNHLYAATTNTLAATSFPRSPTINSLTAFLIVQTCLIREEEPLTSCSFVGMAMRVAQSMGLHRDGSLFGLGEIECEIRRRVWWHIMYLDVQGAIAAGLPPVGGSGEDLFDTKMVSELKDEFIGNKDLLSRPSSRASSSTAEGKRFSNNCETLKSRTSPAMILAVGRYESTVLLRKIICRLFGINPPRKTDVSEMAKMIFELRAKLEEKISRIPARGLPEMGFIPPRDGKLNEKNGTKVEREENQELERAGVFNSWARIMLSMLSDRAFSVLYQPFLKSTKSKLWQHARNCALRSCHSFLRKFIHLARSPIFQPYQWFCPGTYQPLHATMILLLDLYERPLAPEAPRSRVFVDEVFALFGENGNYSIEDGEACPRPLLEGGREAWKMMSRLRRKSYLRAGLDVDGAHAAEDQTSMQYQQRRFSIQQLPREHNNQSGTDYPDYRPNMMHSGDVLLPPNYMPRTHPSWPQDMSGAISSQDIPPTSYPHAGGYANPMSHDASTMNTAMASLADQDLSHMEAGGELSRLLMDPHNGNPNIHMNLSTPSNHDQHHQQHHYVSSLATPNHGGVIFGQVDSDINMIGEAVLGGDDDDEGNGGDAVLGMDPMDISNEDFDWEEWDTVFGKYVSIDVDEGLSPGDWGI